MSSLFSIGEDELDLDDEDCLLAACSTGTSVNCSTDTPRKNSGLNQNQSSSKTQLLRTKEVEKPESYYLRRPFESISNINTSDRVCDKKRTSTERLYRSCSFNQPKNSTNSATTGLGMPVAKRFAIDSTCNSTSCSSSTKPSITGNGKNFLRSSSVPSFKNTDNSSPVSRSSLNPQMPKLSQSDVRPSNLSEIHKQVDPSNTISSPYKCDSTNTSRHLPGKQFSGLHEVSSIPFQNSYHLKAAGKNATSSVWQQNRSLTRSPVIDIQSGGNFPTTMGNANTASCNQTERQSAVVFNKNLNGAKALPTPEMSRQSVGARPITPQAYQAVTPRMNRSLTRTPSSSKTPNTRKFPGPAGLLPKLSAGQNLDDTSFASPLPTVRKPSPAQSKVSQSSTSEDEDFNRDPWTCMYQDFLKNVPLAMRYTIVRAYTEAIQQKLDRGKVPCLCALVKAFSLTESDASVLLKDPTGEIHGTLHRKVLENYQTELAPGAGLVLKHVSVFSPAPRKHYLNITPGNILQIYPPDPQYISSSQCLASQCTQAEGKQKEQRKVVEEEVIGEEVDYNKQQRNSTEGSTEEESWIQEDCFDDLLEGLDDDDDFLDDALLV